MSIAFFLGDIFEAWIGDDDDSELAARFAEAMKNLADRGTAIFFMRGNRDFLVGERYLQQFNAELLGDTAEISVAGLPALLMHGDLCARMTLTTWLLERLRTIQIGKQKC